MNKLSEAFDFRHACKVFDETKKISSQDIEMILEAGRKSPSSFGLEPWHFVVVTESEMKQQFAKACYNQPQITSCSHFIIVLYRKANQFTIQSEYLRQTVQQNLPTEGPSFEVDAACQYFINYCNNGLPAGVSVDNWSEMQGYIPSANMMTMAAYCGIDSCAIGGFENNKIMSLLETNKPKLNSNNFSVGLCLAFGYRKNPQSPQIRWGQEEVITFL